MRFWYSHPKSYSHNISVSVAPFDSPNMYAMCTVHCARLFIPRTSQSSFWWRQHMTLWYERLRMRIACNSKIWFRECLYASCTLRVKRKHWQANRRWIVWHEFERGVSFVWHQFGISWIIENRFCWPGNIPRSKSDGERFSTAFVVSRLSSSFFFSFFFELIAEFQKLYD